MSDTPDPGSVHYADDQGPDDASPLDILRRAIERRVERDAIEWPVPDRPGFRVRYSVDDLTPAVVQDIQKRCTVRNVTDNDKMSALLLAHCNTGLVIDSTLVTDGGRPLRMADDAVRQMLGVTTAADSVRVFYGGPTRNYGFGVQRHANDLLDAAGLRDEAEDPLDPTN